MITEAYIKGRCDYGIGKYAVVIVQGGELVHKIAYKVGKEFPFGGQTYVADQYNCEIVAACYAANWCKSNGVKALNIYANTTTCQKWYGNREFPDERELGNTFNEYAKDIDVYSEYIPKKDLNEFNVIVNKLAEKA